MRNPTDVTAEVTKNVRFFVQATGYGSFRYQWYHNGRKINNGRSQYLYINGISKKNVGTYYSIACNSDNYCTTSSKAVLTVTG